MVMVLAGQVQDSWLPGFKTRFELFLQVTDPRNVWLTSTDIQRAKDALRDPGSLPSL